MDEQRFHKRVPPFFLSQRKWRRRNKSALIIREDWRDERVTVAEIIRNFAGIGSGRAVLWRAGAKWSRREREEQCIISVLARQNIAVDPLRNWRHTGVYGATTNHAAGITCTHSHAHTATPYTHEYSGVTSRYK